MGSETEVAEIVRDEHLAAAILDARQLRELGVPFSARMMRTRSRVGEAGRSKSVVGTFVNLSIDR
jgi:hypothetical protein